MSERRAVWIDLRCMPQQRGLWPDAQPHGDIARIAQLAEAAPAIAAHRPHFVCVEYDYPDHVHLAVVPWVRREFPALPLLMFTEYHTEALAVWAFRHRVWDYRVKPVTAETLACLIETLMSAAVDPGASAPSDRSFPGPCRTGGAGRVNWRLDRWRSRSYRRAEAQCRAFSLRNN